MAVNWNLHERQPNKVLRHAVSLLSLHQVGLVRFQDPERRVVLKRRENSRARTFSLLEEPNNCRNSHNRHYAENDQGGQQCTGL